MRILSYFVNANSAMAVTKRQILFCLFVVLSLGVDGALSQSADDGAKQLQVELGRTLFADVSLSHDGRTSCQSCHNPAHAYADSHPRSMGTDGRVGTRNAPSLVGIGNDTTFFWDGRRTKLEDVVIDPFTNPVELGLPSVGDVIARLRLEPNVMGKFRAAFPTAPDVPSIAQVSFALAAFVRSLDTGTSAFDQMRTQQHALSAEADRGRRLFDGIAGCSSCHAMANEAATFSDGQYHHSGIGAATQSVTLPELTKSVVAASLDATALGPKVLTDADWSALGRFTVTHKPADIGAFRTPSLRNVAMTAPYMHDGSIATLSAAVDHEIYYRGFSSGHPTNLTQTERQAIVAFLETLTDVDHQPNRSQH